MYLERPGDTAERSFHALHVGEGDIAGDRLDAADSRRHTAFGGNRENADIAGALDVGAAAQFTRRADIDHAHLVTVFFAEEHHCAGFLRLLDRHHAQLAIDVFEDFGVDDILDAADFLVGQRTVMHEVKARLVRIDL